MAGRWRDRSRVSTDSERLTPILCSYSFVTIGLSVTVCMQFVFSLCQKSRDIKMAARGRDRSKVKTDSERLTPIFYSCSFVTKGLSVTAYMQFRIFTLSKVT